MRRGYILLGLYALAVVPRLLILALKRGELEFWEYETLATNLANGSGYLINRFGHVVLAFGDGNLYSFMAGVVYATVGHHPLVLGVVQALLASLAIPVLYVIAERPFGQACAATGAVLAALHPGLLAYTLKLHPLGLDVLLITLLVFWSLKREWSRGSGVLAGLVLGLNLMSRPTYFVAGIAAFGVRWITQRVDRRYLVAAVGIGAMVAMPWITRNWIVLGTPVLLSTSFEDVWKGNNEAASGSSFVAPGQTVYDVARTSLHDRIWQSTELQANALFARETLEFVQEQPTQFVELVARKFLYFWWLPREAGALYPAAWLTTYQLYALVMYAFAAIGAAVIVRGGSPVERNLLATLASVGVVLALLHALAYVEGRHRWGIEPLLLLLTARGLFAVVCWLRGMNPDATSVASVTSTK